MRTLPLRLQTSARRYEQVGRLRVTFAYGLIAVLYLLRVPLATLAKIYAKTCATQGVFAPGGDPLRRRTFARVESPTKGKERFSNGATR